jgi:hypothetical protein
VQPARQRLEEFFMGLVAKAQAEQAATSGALQGGQTARFLGAGAEPATQAQGRELVDDLKRGDDRPVVTAAVKAPVAPTVQQDVLSELSASPTPTSAPGSPATPSSPSSAPSASVAPGKAPAPKAAGKDVDRSIIEGLLGDQGDAPKGKQG